MQLQESFTDAVADRSHDNKHLKRIQSHRYNFIVASSLDMILFMKYGHFTG